MSYFSIDTLVNAYCGFYLQLKSLFWGFLGILSLLDDDIHSCEIYSFKQNDLGDFLNRLFAFEDITSNGKSSDWFVIFSNDWIQKVKELCYKDENIKPNIDQIAVWVFRKENFDMPITRIELRNLFLEKFNLKREHALRLFDFSEDIPINMDDYLCENKNLLDRICSKIQISGKQRTKYLSGEGTFIVAQPSELQRAPFGQPLYAGQKVQECLLLTRFPLSLYYPIINMSRRSTNRQCTSLAFCVLAAVRTKPFILLAGISGTGKSRLVRQLARATCPDGFGTVQRPGNFEMIQVRPNWHDSTELLGYVSRISGKPEFVLTDFIRFLAKAWLHPEAPFFLCLDEMNLAPVEQYFAEYLSVIETRSRGDDGEIVTDALAKIPPEVMSDVLPGLFPDSAETDGDGHPLYPRATALRERFRELGGLPIPPNLVVMGTVNMDETTFSFSRKVLDRAMSFELNEVDMHAGLEGGSDSIGKIDAEAVMASHLTGGEVWQADEALGEKVIAYLEVLNGKLEGTPFKIAYRSRNEIMIYVWERTVDGASLRTALDEATSMKILSRLEGDEQRFPGGWIEDFSQLVRQALEEVDPAGEGETSPSLCRDKLSHMADQLKATGFTSFWS